MIMGRSPDQGALARSSGVSSRFGPGDLFGEVAHPDVGALRGVGEQVEGLVARDVGFGSQQSDGLSDDLARVDGVVQALQLSRCVDKHST
jgi:hypothetical protein